jgi:hypothetical protein
MVATPPDEGTTTMKNQAGNAAAALAAMRMAAHVADHWLQTGHQALHKADSGLDGHRAMAGHVASYAGAQAVALVAVNGLLGMKLKPSRIAAAVALSGATHWFIDRRWPVRKLAEALGKTGCKRDGRCADPEHAPDGSECDGGFHGLGGPLGGAYILDQSAHHLMEAVAAVVAARD